MLSATPVRTRVEERPLPPVPPDQAGPVEEAPTRQWWDLVVVGLLALAGIFAPGLPAALRIPTGVVAVLFVPGYALITAIFPTDKQLDMLERLGLALAASFGLIAVQAFLLDKAPGGLSPDMIRSAVSGTSLILLVAAAFHRGWRADGGRVWRRAPAGTRPSRAARFTSAIALASVLVAGLAYSLAAGSPPAAPTEFYLLGAESRLARYPRVVAPGEPIALRVGVRQGGGAPGRYRITARSGDAVLATSQPIALNPGARWEELVPVAMARSGPDQELGLFLERDGDPRPFRSLRLWLDVRTPGPT